MSNWCRAVSASIGKDSFRQLLVFGWMDQKLARHRFRLWPGHPSILARSLQKCQVGRAVNPVHSSVINLSRCRGGTHVHRPSHVSEETPSAHTPDTLVLSRLADRHSTTLVFVYPGIPLHGPGFLLRPFFGTPASPCSSTQRCVFPL